MSKIKVETQMLSGGVWFAAWLFTIGFLNLSFGQGVLAVVVWPYYLGVFFGGEVEKRKNQFQTNRLVLVLLRSLLY